MAAKGRPPKMEGDTKTYNAIFPTDLLDRLHKRAADIEQSSPDVLRKALEKYLESESGEPDGYKRGVLDALELVEKNPKLQGRMSTGTFGEVIVREIKKKLNGR